MIAATSASKTKASLLAKVSAAGTSGSKAPKIKKLNSGLLNYYWAISTQPSSVLSALISTPPMLKPILKMPLKKPIYLGLCPKPRFGGNSKGTAFATPTALEKPTQTCNLKQLKCYLCSEPEVLPMF